MIDDAENNMTRKKSLFTDKCAAYERSVHWPTSNRTTVPTKVLTKPNMCVRTLTPERLQLQLKLVGK